MSPALHLSPLRLSTRLGLSVGAIFCTYRHLHRPAFRLDSSSAGGAITDATAHGRCGEEVQYRGLLDARAVRQMSAGSFVGLCAGLIVSTFSKALAMMLGFVFVGITYASHKNLYLLPYSLLERYLTRIDVRKAMRKNFAWKICFGITFTMAGFLKF